MRKHSQGWDVFSSNRFIAGLPQYGDEKNDPAILNLNTSSF